MRSRTPAPTIDSQTHTHVYGVGGERDAGQLFRQPADAGAAPDAAHRSGRRCLRAPLPRPAGSVRALRRRVAGALGQRDTRCAGRRRARHRWIWRWLEAAELGRAAAPGRCGRASTARPAPARRQADRRALGQRARPPGADAGRHARRPRGVHRLERLLPAGAGRLQPHPRHLARARSGAGLCRRRLHLRAGAGRRRHRRRGRVQPGRRPACRRAGLRRSCKPPSRRPP